LYLNGILVGWITVQGLDTSWTFGRFEPRAAFSDFAPIFGRWSLLMHIDEELPLDGAAAIELSQTEREIDALRPRVCFSGEDAWHEVAELNIDGTLIEWKEV